MLSGLAHDYPHLLAGRALVGIGEAALRGDRARAAGGLFPPRGAAACYAIFNMAIPVGRGARLRRRRTRSVQHFGWRAAFFVAGAPGMRSRSPCWGLLIRRAACRTAAAAERPAARPRARACTHGLLRAAPPTCSWCSATLPTPSPSAGSPSGCRPFSSACAGCRPRGDHRAWRHRAGDRFRRHVRRRLARGLPAALHAAGVPVVLRAVTLAAAPLALLALTAPTARSILPAIVAGELLLFMSTGPVNAAIVNIVSPSSAPRRSRSPCSSSTCWATCPRRCSSATCPDHHGSLAGALAPR